ncbi:MAG: hypothetical protein DGJ47_000795 [Rickettsiaceae bacterium]
MAQEQAINTTGFNSESYREEYETQNPVAVDLLPYFDSVSAFNSVESSMFVEDTSSMKGAECIITFGKRSRDDAGLPDDSEQSFLDNPAYKQEFAEIIEFSLNPEDSSSELGYSSDEYYDNFFAEEQSNDDTLLGNYSDISE